jgi:hypothetical protein
VQMILELVMSILLTVILRLYISHFFCLPLQ